jgi:ribosome biogenesis GTPase A
MKNIATLTSKLQHNKFIQTEINTIYTVNELSKTLDLYKYGNESKELFMKSLTSYISPLQFNHKLPSSGIPELAFIGRSNVGKSSLIDCLLGNYNDVENEDDDDDDENNGGDDDDNEMMLRLLLTTMMIITTRLMILMISIR